MVTQTVSANGSATMPEAQPGEQKMENPFDETVEHELMRAIDNYDQDWNDDGAANRLANKCVAIGYEFALRARCGELPSDVARLVVISRRIAFDGHFDNADEDQRALLRELEQASEEFADRAPWEDEPRPMTSEAQPGQEQRMENVSAAKRVALEKTAPLRELAAAMEAARPTADLCEDGDLVEALRKRAAWQRENLGDMLDYGTAYPELEQAADRIELYREALGDHEKRAAAEARDKIDAVLSRRCSPPAAASS